MCYRSGTGDGHKGRKDTYLDKGECWGLQVARHAVRVGEGITVVLRREGKKVALVISSSAPEMSGSPLVNYSRARQSCSSSRLNRA